MWCVSGLESTPLWYTENNCTALAYFLSKTEVTTVIDRNGIGSFCFSKVTIKKNIKTSNTKP